MTGQHRDDDGDGLADRGRPVIPAELLDRQSEAFRSQGDLSVPDEQLANYLTLALPPTTDPAEIVTPEQWEAAGWDAGRIGPKGLDEARAALQARIDDPHAPDGPEVAGAYDDGGPW